MVFLFVFRNRWLSGAYEARSATFCLGGTFFCTDGPGYLNRAGMFAPFRAGGFSLRFSEEMRRLRTAGTCRAPRRGKRVDTKVSTLLTPTSFWEGLAQIVNL